MTNATIEEIIRQLTGNGETIRALVQTISDEQAQWKPKNCGSCVVEPAKSQNEANTPV